MQDLQTMRREYSATMRYFGFGPEMMKKIRVCSACGCSCGTTEIYCKDCGAVLTSETLFDQYKARHLCCPMCDTVVANTVVYCPECGKRLRPWRFNLFGSRSSRR